MEAHEFGLEMVKAVLKIIFFLGSLLYTNQSHRGPIFSIKWNPSANKVLSAGGDNSTIVWDPKNNKTDKFSFHSSSALDIDWITDDIFASCSVDRCIHICKIGLNAPYKTFYVSFTSFDKNQIFAGP